MHENYQIDNVDRQILELLQKDARMPYLDIARKLVVSGGTIHQRIDKMKSHGIIKGNRIELDHKRLGRDVTALLGLHLTSSKALKSTISKIEQLKEVLEVYYTTGNYALLIKVTVRSIDDFHDFLVNKLQAIESIRATESFMVLDTPVKRDLCLRED